MVSKRGREQPRVPHVLLYATIEGLLWLILASCGRNLQRLLYSEYFVTQSCKYDVFSRDRENWLLPFAYISRHQLINARSPDSLTSPKLKYERIFGSDPKETARRFSFVREVQVPGDSMRLPVLFPVLDFVRPILVSSRTHQHDHDS